MTGLAMPKTRYLQRRGSRYYFRMRVPSDLKSAFEQETIFERLNATDWRAARSEINRRVAYYEDRFEELRGNVPRSDRKFAWEDVDRIVAAWLNTRLQQIALTAPTEVIDGVLSFGDIKNDMQSTARLLTQLQTGSGAEADQLIEDQTHALLLDDGYPAVLHSVNTNIQPSPPRRTSIPDHTPEFTYMRRQVHSGLEAISKATLLKFRGQSTIDAALFPIQPRSVTTKTLTVAQLLSEFQAEKRKERYGQRKLLMYGVISAIMLEVFGPEKHLDAITAVDCRRLIEVLRSIPPNAKKRFRDLTYVEAASMAVENDLSRRAAATINSDIHAASAIFNWAVDQDYIVKSPMPRRSAKKLDAPRPDEQRDAFSIDDLRTVFASPIYAVKNSQAAGTYKTTPARYWIPLLALFHGCRLNELCQLYTDDVELDGAIPHLLIRDARPDQKLKTSWSRRTIPIHPKLLELGFADFVRDMVTQRNDRLFPELSRCKRGYYSSSFQKWFSRLLKETNVKRPKISFHSFRHCFRNAIRQNKTPAGIYCRLGGWQLENVHERYGHIELSLLADEVRKIDYGLALPKVFTISD